LWLNGGPGCSSIGGAFIEHGPFKPSRDNLVKNNYSWNKEANILYLESPAGVGFSYSANNSFYNYVNDEITARDGLTFLQGWFTKFPEYRDRDFFIAGESYGGHYVPQLAQLITQSNVKFNLKGIAIGNPLLEFAVDFNSPDEYYWSHGLISDTVHELLTKGCNSSQIMRSAINGYFSTACTFVYNQLERELSEFIDTYNVIGDVCLSSGLSQMDMLYQPLKSRFQTLSSLNSQSNALNQQEIKAKDDVCGQVNTRKYLNRKDVQKALHARLIGVKEHTLCSRVLHYDDKNREIPTINVVGSLVKSGIRALVYSGDQDGVIPFTGTRTLVNGLAKELGLKATVPYRAWLEKKQVGGWTQVYGNIQLSFASIRGASHTAPVTQPARSLLLFKSFLAGKPLPEA
jgi:serine carboxypeptidase-like clade 2